MENHFLKTTFYPLKITMKVDEILQKSLSFYWSKKSDFERSRFNPNHGPLSG